MASIRAVVAVLALSAATSAAAQNLRAVAVPWVATDPAVPHLAYNGHATTFKAIARGGNGTYLVEWDFQGDGYDDFAATRTNRYDLSTRFTYPNQAADTTFTARLRVTSNGQSVVTSYPVRVLAAVPSNPANATASQLQAMRHVAIDDGLWYLHNQMSRSGNEEDPVLGAQIQGNLGSYPTTSTAGLLEALAMNGHFPAFPAAYLGAMPDAAANAARWRDDPYAEDAARLVNFLLTRATIVAVTTADEGNLVGSYPEVSATPIAGSDDGIGVWIGYSPGDLTTGPHSNALRGLALAHLAGYVAQVGDPSRILGRPFELVIQQMVDALVWAQNEAGYPGSWYYTPNAGNDMLGEYAGGVLEAEEALLVAERAMGDAGVIVPNLAKARLASYIQQSQNVCATGGIGGSYYASSSVCDFALSAANLVAWGWMGANLHSTTDGRLAFPSYSGLTFGQLRASYDGTLTFIANTFNATAPGLNNWDIGFVPGGDFTRNDGSGDLWSMLHWTRAARSVQPPIATFGNNDHARLFSGYLIRNQAPNGDWNWMLSSMMNYNDQIVGAETRATWAIIMLSGESGVVPVAWASIPYTMAPEGTPFSFTGESHVAEAAAYRWSFGDGQTGEGRQIDHAYPDNGMFAGLLTVTTSAGSSEYPFNVFITNVAPVPAAGPDLAVDEGSLASFSGTFVDPGDDTHAYSWQFGDTHTAASLVASNVYADQGVFNVSLRVTDDDGGTGVDVATVTVRNVAPHIVSTPPAGVVESATLTYTLAFTDPGASDTHSCTAPVRPAGATFTGCTIQWTPAVGELSAPAPFTLCVMDDDGDDTCQSFDVAVTPLDADGDGLPDSWESRFFGGLTETAAGDFDLDGLTNAEELAAGTDPTRWDGPGLPVVLAPSCGSRLAADRPALVVANAVDPHGMGRSYQFEVYDQASTSSPAATSGDVPTGPGYTAWEVDVPLQEDHTYLWRARTGDGVVFGGWTSLTCSFVVDVVAGHRELTVTDALVGAACDAYGNGGQRTLSGVDDGAGGGTADDGVLQPGEVRSSTVVCNGGNGTPGQPGGDGHAALLVTDALVGSACDAYGNGGQRIRSGVDDGAGGGTADDGVLQPGEVEASTIVCNGKDGAAGPSGGGCGSAPGTASAWPSLLVLAAFVRRRVRSRRS